MRRGIAIGTVLALLAIGLPVAAQPAGGDADLRLTVETMLGGLESTAGNEEWAALGESAVPHLLAIAADEGQRRSTRESILVYSDGSLWSKLPARMLGQVAKVGWHTSSLVPSFVEVEVGDTNSTGDSRSPRLKPWATRIQDSCRAVPPRRMNPAARA